MMLGMLSTIGFAVGADGGAQETVTEPAALPTEAPTEPPAEAPAEVPADEAPGLPAGLTADDLALLEQYADDPGALSLDEQARCMEAAAQLNAGGIAPGGAGGGNAGNVSMPNGSIAINTVADLKLLAKNINKGDEFVWGDTTVAGSGAER